jgi:hypothetical protein
VGYQVCYDISGNIIIAKRLTDKDLIDTSATTAIQDTQATAPDGGTTYDISSVVPSNVTPCPNAMKSRNTAGAIAGSTTSTTTAVAAGVSDVSADLNNSAGTTNANASGTTDTANKSTGTASAMGTIVDTAGQRKSSRSKGKRTAVPSATKRSSTSSVKQQQPAKKFKGFCDPSETGSSSCVQDNQDDNSEILKNIWSDYAEQIQQYYREVKEDRGSRGFILQQVAGHVNKRARHLFKEELQAGLIDFLNQHIDPALNKEEEEFFREAGYDATSKFAIIAPKTLNPK